MTTTETFFIIVANLGALNKIFEVILVILGICCCVKYLKE